jgi:hypothetical protein
MVAMHLLLLEASRRATQALGATAGEASAAHGPLNPCDLTHVKCTIQNNSAYVAAYAAVQAAETAEEEIETAVEEAEAAEEEAEAAEEEAEAAEERQALLCQNRAARGDHNMARLNF